MSIVAGKALDSDLVFRIIGLSLVLLGLLSIRYTSTTPTLAPQIIPIYYFISALLVIAGLFGLVSVIRD